MQNKNNGIIKKYILPSASVFTGALITSYLVFIGINKYTVGDKSEDISGIRGSIISVDNKKLAILKDVNYTRIYPLNSTLSTVIGYVSKKDNNTSIRGVNGIEKSYDKELNSGSNILLNIPLKLQQSIEQIADQYKAKLEADEVLVSVMESHTGKILSLATSNRFNPNDIKKDALQNINNTAIEHTYEPGSVIKPITVALALEKEKATLSEELPAYNEGKKDKDGYYPKGIIHIDRWNIIEEQSLH